MTDCSSLTGESFTPVAVSTFTAAAPHGTSGAHTTSFTPDLARSANDAMPAGLSGGVTMTSVFVAKFTGLPVTRPASVAFVMFATSAEAKTSPGAPPMRFATRSEDPAKLKFTVVPGFSFVNVAPSSVNVGFNDAAAYTVRVPAATTAMPRTRSRRFCSPIRSRPAARTLATRATAAAATGKRRLTKILRGFRR